MSQFNELFKNTPIHPKLEEALKKINFTSAKEIQIDVIPLALDKKDIIACAETGSGKTAAYSIPIIQRLLEDEHREQSIALVLAPTRELVQQISIFIKSLTDHSKQLDCVSLVGGSDMRRQIRALERKPKIVVATPGRLIDHLKRKTLNLSTCRTLVLDEGDRMLDMGFAPQLDTILTFLPKQRQSSLYTATLPKKVKSLASKYLNQPIMVGSEAAPLPVASIKQSMIQVTAKEKNNKLVDELIKRRGSIIIFTKTQIRTDDVAKHLSSFGFKVDIIHGGRSQGQRNRALQSFRAKKSQILCATDVAARGLDVPHVEHVVNYDLPMMEEDFVHRVGRTARNGAEGEALSFVTPQEQRYWNLLSKKYQMDGLRIAGIESGPREQRSSRSSKSSRGGGPRTASKKKFGAKKDFGAKTEFGSKKKFGAKKKKSSYSEKSYSENAAKPFKKRKFKQNSRSF